LGRLAGVVDSFGGLAKLLFLALRMNEHYIAEAGLFI
jgi:hypothetical protein